MDYGVWTLVPVLLVIVFALKTKRTLESLIFGTMLTYVITVSYTHLDVYKRQTKGTRPRRQGVQGDDAYEHPPAARCSSKESPWRISR